MSINPHGVYACSWVTQGDFQSYGLFVPHGSDGGGKIFRLKREVEDREVQSIEVLAAGAFPESMGLKRGTYLQLVDLSKEIELRGESLSKAITEKEEKINRERSKAPPYERFRELLKALVKSDKHHPYIVVVADKLLRDEPGEVLHHRFKLVHI